MKDDQKTKEQLIEELDVLRLRVTDLEKSGTRGRLRESAQRDIDITGQKRTAEALREANGTIDQDVTGRTDRLQLANESLQNEIEERKRVETVLRQSKDRLRRLTNRLLSAQENERKRIAVELHDELGQSLVGLKFQLSSFKKKLGGNQEELQQEMEQALNSIDLMTEKVRHLSRELRPYVLEHLGLFEALQWLFEDFSKKYHFTVMNKIKNRDCSFYKEQEILLFRIFQEALANIGKHARADQVLIELTEEGRSAVFSIKDNGKGFNPKSVKGESLSEIGLGLTAMAERAQMAGGAFDIKTEVGRGTVITFSVPVKRTRKQSPSLSPQE